MMLIPYILGCVTSTVDGGATVQQPEDTQPSQYFSLFWIEEWWQHLVVETNRYANDQGPHRKWTPVTVSDLKAFHGLMLGMGILKSNVYSDYWRTSKRLFMTQFGKVMPRDRFLTIWRYLHLADNNAPQRDNPDKLAKLRPMLTHLNRVFKENYTPYRDVSIDESMVQFKGRLGFRQYLPSKPIKWGIKIWALSESTTGYMSNFQVYTGREAGQELVKDLVAPYHHTGMRVYMDNFYTGVPLLCELATLGIGGCGTVRANRKFLPTELLPKRVRLDKHQHQSAQAENMTFCVWQDTKAVCVLSNFHDPLRTGTINRQSGRQQQHQVEVPEALSKYQSFMMGVDLTDQMIGYYMQNHK
ncbi:hypothetical protein RRG08_011667 [Elysia crispata]|uniref:PiggyBac transposable element-derived protein domain-containing protein n=1 Tax=Elysia crispata TaxID=231223 RepID=A0AAE0YLX2_9GAST|nr:hypothetical protein RRG08_011667 [Elysia crispata]